MDNEQREFLSLPPLVTILKAEEDEIDRIVSTIDQERLITYILKYSDGILVGGTTGYGPSLTDNQFNMLLRIALNAKKTTFPDKRLLVGAIEVSDGRVKQKIYRTFQMEQETNSRVDGFVVAPPAFFYRHSSTEVFKAMKSICSYAQKYDKAIYIYNIGRSGFTFQPNEIKELKKIKNVKGLKDSSGDYELFKEFLQFQEDDFEIFQGKPQFNLQTMENGANGIVDANANFAPSLVRDMIQAFLNANHTEAEKIHNRLLDSTDYLNQDDPCLAENRLAARCNELYLLGVIDSLPRPFTEQELVHVGKGLIRNEIPKVDSTTLDVAGPFTDSDLKNRISRLKELGYSKDEAGRYQPISMEID